VNRTAWLLLLCAGLLTAGFVGYREVLAPGLAEKPQVSNQETHSEHGPSHGEKGEGFVKLTSAQIQAAGIEIAPVTGGKLLKEIIVPGRVTINADKQAKIVPRLSGAVVRINKRLGEGVVENDVLAVLESREIADAKAEFLAARRAEELAKSVLDRNEKMWKDKIIPEKDLIASRNAHQHTLIKFDLAHQRLHTMGLSEAEIDALPSSADETTFRFYEIRSPIAGRVTARNVLLGQAVTTDKDIFTVAELSTVWIELAVAPGDLPFAREGQEVRVYSGSREASAKVVALSPVIDPDTRSAKAIAELDNTAGDWKLGDFVSGKLIAGEQEANLLVPRVALQTVKGKKVVFVAQGAGAQQHWLPDGLSWRRALLEEAAQRLLDVVLDPEPPSSLPQAPPAPPRAPGA
jgi:cobalt-zinc-cadmium efflux system membrane fusion protein